MKMNRATANGQPTQVGHTGEKIGNSDHASGLFSSPSSLKEKTKPAATDATFVFEIETLMRDFDLKRRMAAFLEAPMELESML